jgi:hypothetical protein
MIFAYIDPGAGSMAIQALIAAALAVPFFLRQHISRGIDRLRGRNFQPDEEAAQTDD